MENIKLLGHSGVKLLGNKIIYIDPYKLGTKYNDADYIFITHNHYDHYSPEDILKVKNESSVIIITPDLKEDVLALGFSENNIVTVTPENSYELNDIKFFTTYSYNKEKAFHPKSNNWVGYIISMNNMSYYIAGDTDYTDDLKSVKCDIALVPVGGTYTMDYKDAANLVNEIRPKVAIPIHYGSIVGTRDDAEKFSELLDSEIECKIMM